MIVSTKRSWRWEVHHKRYFPAPSEPDPGVFWVNIAKFELNLRYRYCLNLIGKLRKEKEFRQQCCRNSTKIGERNKKSWREKEEEFQQRCYRNSSAQIPAWSCVLCARVWSGQKNKKEAICGNGIAKNGGKKNWMELWQCHCRKWEEKKMLLPKSKKKF